MPSEFMLDTNIVSYLLKGQMLAVRSRFNRVTAEHIAISVITEAEILYGLARISGARRRRFAAEVFLAGITRLPWDSVAAASFAALRAEQERKGKSLSVEDMMIAAHALSLGLTLVTHDHAFSFVDGLKTEDWTVPAR